MVHVLDLNFFQSHTVASFLVQTTAGPVLVETGPYSTFPALIKGINRLGYKASDIQHVLLTHIHLDHAGAAWAMAEMGAKIYVHPKGYEHLANPEKLLSSAKRIYQDQMESLWGSMKPIAESRLVACENGTRITVGETEFVAWHTPGHAYHHIAWQKDKVVFAGDVGGVSIEGGPVQPPCPPPDIDPPAWFKSIELLRSLEPERLYLTHFGARDNVSAHLDQLYSRLDNWSQWVRNQLADGSDPLALGDAFLAMVNTEMADKGVDDELLNKYNAANPAFMSLMGLARYWQKQGLSHEAMVERAQLPLE